MIRVHHFNAVSMCPAGGGLIMGGPLGTPAELVCHCLLVESSVGLVLVETGMFASDESTARRTHQSTMRALRPRPGIESTAKKAIEKLGFSADDVQHVIPTHLDVDHAGGLPDFPRATVHVHSPELDAATARATLMEQLRYVPAQWKHEVKWERYESGGDSWQGFGSVRPLEGEPDIAIIPLEGHTRGHVGVAIRTTHGWMLHAGDAYFHAREMFGSMAPVALEIFQLTVAADDSLRRRNRDRLRLLSEGGEVRVFCAHSREELDRYT